MANNSPKDLDLSACTVSIDGGGTPKQLSEVAKTVNDINGNIANINAVANEAKKGVDDINQKINPDTYFAKDGANKPLGTTILDKTGQFTYPPPKTDDGFTWINAGLRPINDDYTQDYEPNPKSREIHMQYSVNSDGNEGNNKTFVNTIWSDGTNPNFAFAAISFHPLNAGGGDLGRAGNPWNNIFTQTAPNVTSDKNVKTITSILDEKADNSDKKLMDALYNVNAVNYRLNDAIKEKGEDKARVHTGFIAQDIEQAIRDAGLDPSDYAMWTQDASPEFKRVDTGEKDKNGNPILKSVQEIPKDEKGNVILRQNLRYTEVLCMLLAAHKQKINDLEARLVKLEGKSK
ncbi:tail fiber domain-containing protein [Commensalibacter sp. A3DC]|uniref:tail fiber domain-containing protein n=1 Tax=Commensalibacter sp. A3DC TaxID=3093920 RepID=UPI0039B42C31